MKSVLLRKNCGESTPNRPVVKEFVGGLGYSKMGCGQFSNKESQNMRTLVLTTILLPLMAVAAPRQNTTQGADSSCHLTVKDAPAIRGIRLGMTTEELLEFFPGSHERPEIRAALEKAKSPTGYDVSYLGFYIPNYQDLDRFRGVESVSVTTYKDRVVDLRVTYIGPASNGPNWRSTQEWIAKLSEAFGLPPAPGWENGNTLKCDGMEITAGVYNGRGEIRLRAPAYQKEVRDRVESDADGKRREFKP
jgi:hypothetical protein